MQISTKIAWTKHFNTGVKVRWRRPCNQVAAERPCRPKVAAREQFVVYKGARVVCIQHTCSVIYMVLTWN